MQNSSKQDLKIEILAMISFYLKHIYRKEQEQIAPETTTPTDPNKGRKRLTLTKSENEVVNNLAQNLVPILAQLINSIKVLSKDLKHIENTLPALDLIQQILQLLEARDIEYNEETQVLRNTIANFNDFFV